jgi:hypothetical protein
MPEILIPPTGCAMAFGLVFFIFATVGEIFHWIDPENNPSPYAEVWNAILRNIRNDES